QLGLDEAGAHMRAILWCWTEGPLPLDAAARARILGSARARDGERLWAGVAHLWRETETGFVAPRLELERQKQADYRALQAAKGRRSGAARSKRQAEKYLQDRTAVQQRLNSVEPKPNRHPESGSHSVQPDVNSSIFDLRSA